MIKFFADNHTYWNKDQKMRSVGSVYGDFFPKFERDYWLTHGAIKDVIGENALRAEKKENMSHAVRPHFPELLELVSRFKSKTYKKFVKAKQKLSSDWEYEAINSNYKGSLFHDAQEKNDYLQKGCINPWTGDFVKIRSIQDPKIADNFSTVNKLSDLKDGYYAELLIFNKKLNIAGQADQVWIQTIDGVRYIWISDYKTNKAAKKPTRPKVIPKIGDGKYENSYSAKMPIHHLKNTNFFKYSMQVGLYAWMLEQEGFQVAGLQLLHIRNYDIKTATKIKIDYLKDEIEMLVEEYKNSL